MISVLNEGLTCQTAGLLDQTGYEISATVDNPLLLSECKELVQFLGDYVAAGNAIQSGEIVKYGYWLVKVNLDDRRRLVFWEYNPEATDFVLGVSSTVSHWRDQHQICQKVDAVFSPPRLDQLVVISDGVYEGDEVEGVRYPSPDHMSGWWLTTDRFNGDTSTLKTVHAHHVSARRPDLAKFLALPFGYRFFSPQSDVWFDRKVADAES
ncbi:immunity protein Imm33 domain-containing protein [Chitinimonas arctica]|uniref:immunity protein Imm33 domain-containing protein n=1 Tax=Chitinimonas arctica TaxID=2594795 RepID=UPI00402BE7B5